MEKQAHKDARSNLPAITSGRDNIGEIASRIHRTGSTFFRNDGIKVKSIPLQPETCMKVDEKKHSSLAF